MQGTPRHRVFVVALAIAGMLGLPPTSAQLAEVSSGDLEISVVIGARVSIIRLSDIDLGSYSGAGDLSGTSEMCVHRNDTGIYDITISSSHADAGTFQVADGATLVPYAVDFSDASGTVFNGVVSGERLTGLRGHLRHGCVGNSAPGGQGQGNPGNNTPGGANGPTNATLQVHFSESDLQSAAQGNYADVITLLVEPG